MKRILLILLVVFLLYGFYRMLTFSLFDEDFNVVKDISLPGKEYILKVYYIPPNATSQSYIQLRKVENDKETVLANFERYNYFNGYEVVGEDSLILLVSDTLRAKELIRKKVIKLP